MALFRQSWWAPSDSRKFRSRPLRLLHKSIRRGIPPGSRKEAKSLSFKEAVDQLALASTLAPPVGFPLAGEEADGSRCLRHHSMCGTRVG